MKNKWTRNKSGIGFFFFPKILTNQLMIFGEPSGKKEIRAIFWLWFVWQKQEER